MTSPPVAAGSAATAPRPFVVDCQSHLFLPEVLEVLRRRTSEPLVVDHDGTTVLKMGDWIRRVPPSYASVADKLAMMDAHGIDHTLLSTNDPGPEWFADDGPRIAATIHDALAGLATRHPARFSWLGTLPLQDEAAARAELERCRSLPGFRGILLYTNLAGAWCDEPPFHWLYARAESLGLPLLLHPAKPLTTAAVSGYELTGTLGTMFEDTIALARIIASGLLDRHPDLALVCPHLGGALPYLCGRMDHQVRVLKRGPQHLRKRPSDYLRDIFMDIVSPLPEALRFALDFTAADKLLFASDHPWVDAPEILGPLRRLGLPAETESRILGGNARRLFGL
ncbi:MAG: amidohydrolase family protein [Planctomycetaceae bacterium]